MANRAWLYCRIGDGYGHQAKELLDKQEQRLLDYCAQQGLQVSGCTKTVGSSKGELETLASQGLEQDAFDFLVTVSASRLTRDVMNLLTHAQKLADNGMGICIVNDDICTLPVQQADQDSGMEMGGLAQ